MQVWFVQGLEQGGHPVEKCHRHVARARLCKEANLPIRVHQAAVRLSVASRLRLWGRLVTRRVSTRSRVADPRRQSGPIRRRQREHLKRLAVQRDLELLRHVVPRDIDAARPHGFARQTHADVVLSVAGKVVADQRPTAGAERQTVDPVVLRQIGGHPEDIVVRSRRRRSDGGAADVLCGGKVSLHQRRRDLENAGYVVEAIARAISRKQRRHVDVDAEKVANRVSVLGPVQTVERFRSARIGSSGARSGRAASRATTQRPRTWFGQGGALPVEA